MSVTSISRSPQTLQQAAQTLARQNSQSTSGQQNVKKGGHHHGGHRPDLTAGVQSATAVSGTSGTPAVTAEATPPSLVDTVV